MAPDPRAARVLVADDSAVNRRVLEALLRADGHEVLLANDGVEAVERFERDRPDLVMLDALMPRLDGLEACRRIKTSAGDELVPVVFITALEDEHDLEQCVEAGADDFLTKPFDAAVVRTKLRVLLRLRELSRAVRHASRQTPARAATPRGSAAAAPGRAPSRSRVLVVDDSALMRQVLADILARDAEVEVVGTAHDAFAAWEKIQLLRPDVLSLDVDMPKMDGLTFLERLMRLRPMPVVMVSSLTERGCQTTLRALELGAIDFVAKPKLDPLNGTLALADEIVAKVKTAARARIRVTPLPAGPSRGPEAAPAASPPILAGANSGPSGLIAIGASTGGTRAIEELLTALPADAPGVVVVQHMPETFTARFAERLDQRCRIRVREARDGDRVRAGQALIAPGNFHLEVLRAGAELAVRTSSGPPVNGHRPSVDVLFSSCARLAGRGAVGVILTGMGDDGARGLLEMRHAGARTLAQDEASCVVFGMPREAIAIGAAAEVLPLERMAEAALRHARRAA